MTNKQLIAWGASASALLAVWQLGEPLAGTYVDNRIAESAITKSILELQKQAVEADKDLAVIKQSSESTEKKVDKLEGKIDFLIQNQIDSGDGAGPSSVPPQ